MPFDPNNGSKYKHDAVIKYDVTINPPDDKHVVLKNLDSNFGFSTYPWEPWLGTQRNIEKPKDTKNNNPMFLISMLENVVKK